MLSVSTSTLTYPDLTNTLANIFSAVFTVATEVEVVTFCNPSGLNLAEVSFAASVDAVTSSCSTVGIIDEV